MYRSIKASLAPCVILAASLLAACAPSAGPRGSGSGPSGAQVSVSFPVVSRAILGALAEKANGRRSLEGARPFFHATRIEIRLLDSGGALADSVILEPDAQNGESVGTSFAVEAGTYGLEADIYNSACGMDSPVSSGSSGSFTVEAGQRRSVSFPCLPENPSPLADGQESGAIDLTPCMIVNNSPFGLNEPLEYREERWFSFTASGPTIFSATPLDPDRRGYFFAVYDSQGMPVGSLDAQPAYMPDGSASLSLTLNQGEAYYVGCIAYGMSGAAVDFVSPAVFTLRAQTEVLESLLIEPASSYLYSAQLDPRNYAAVLLDSSDLSITATARHPGANLSVDAATAPVGSPFTVAVAEGQTSVSVVATDSQGRTDPRRIWILRATELVDGQESTATSLRGEELFFFMPIEPATEYSIDWPHIDDRLLMEQSADHPIDRAGAEGSVAANMTARLSGYDDLGNAYFSDLFEPPAEGFTSADGASYLLVRARAMIEGRGGALGVTVAHR